MIVLLVPQLINGRATSHGPVIVCEGKRPLWLRNNLSMIVLLVPQPINGRATSHGPGILLRRVASFIIDF